MKIEIDMNRSHNTTIFHPSVMASPTAKEAQQRMLERDKVIADLQAEVARLRDTSDPNSAIPPSPAPIRRQGAQCARTNRVFDFIVAALVAVILVEYAGIRHRLPTARPEFERQVDAHPIAAATAAAKAPNVGAAPSAVSAPTDAQTKRPTLLLLPPTAQPTAPNVFPVTRDANDSGAPTLTPTPAPAPVVATAAAPSKPWAALSLFERSRLKAGAPLPAAVSAAPSARPPPSGAGAVGPLSLLATPMAPEPGNAGGGGSDDVPAESSLAAKCVRQVLPCPRGTSPSNPLGDTLGAFTFECCPKTPGRAKTNGPNQLQVTSDATDAAAVDPLTHAEASVALDPLFRPTPRDLRRATAWHDWRQLVMKPNRTLSKYVDKHNMKVILQQRFGDIPFAKEFLWVNNAADITQKTIETLPPDFVMKANHMSGGIVLVRDGISKCLKSPCSKKKEIRGRKEPLWRYLQRLCAIFLKFEYGSDKKEMFYRAIPRKCLFEQYVPTESLQDYKVFVFHGKAFFLMVTSNRLRGKERDFRTPRWTPIQMTDSATAPMSANLPTPGDEFLASIVSMAQRLSHGFAGVRVDFFVSNNSRAAFSELTFAHENCHAKQTFLPHVAERFYGFVATHPHVAVDPESINHVLPPIRAVAFDFDDTIASVNVHHRFRGLDNLDAMRRMTREEVVDQLFGGAGRVDRLRALFRRLMRNGIKLWICSFSFSAVIRELLQRVDLGFEQYFEPPLMGRLEMKTLKGKETNPANKRRALADLAMQQRLRAHELLFVDDSQRNVMAVGADIAVGFKVRDAGGLNVRRLQAWLLPLGDRVQHTEVVANVTARYTAVLNNLSSDERVNGAFSSEVRALVDMIAQFQLDVFVESGTANGVSTELIARALPSVDVHSVDLDLYHVFNRTRARLQRCCPNVRLHKGDSRERIPALLQSFTARPEGPAKIGIFLDGPKGKEARDLAQTWIQMPNVFFVGIHDTAPFWATKVGKYDKRLLKSVGVNVLHTWASSYRDKWKMMDRFQLRDPALRLSNLVRDASASEKLAIIRGLKQYGNGLDILYKTGRKSGAQTRGSKEARWVAKHDAITGRVFYKNMRSKERAWRPPAGVICPKIFSGPAPCHAAPAPTSTTPSPAAQAKTRRPAIPKKLKKILEA